MDIDSNYQINSFITGIDTNNVDKVKILLKKNNNANHKNNILCKLYEKKLLTYKRLEFLIENLGINNLNLSSSLINDMIENDDNLLSVIIKGFYFFDNEIIVNILNYYKNKVPLSKLALNQQISKYKFLNINEDVIDILFEACKQNNKFIVKYLIKHGVKIDKKNIKGETLLFIACKSKNVKMVKYLIDNGANINERNSDGSPSFFYACESGNRNIINIFIEHKVDINEENNNGETALFYACNSGNEDLVKYLIEHGLDKKKGTS